MNRMLSLTLGAALLVLGCQAQAQRAALVQDRDAPGRAPYQNEIGINPSSSVCPNNFFCVITFPPVPAGQRLVITHAAAEFTNGAAGAGTAYVTGPGGIFGPRMIIPPGQLTTTNRTIASGPMTYYIEPGQSPQVIIAGSSIITSNSAFAMLSGYYITLP